MADGSDPKKVQFQAPEGEETPPEGDPPEGDPDPPEDGDDPDGEDGDEQPLGPKGEKALAAEKARRKGEQRKRREAEEELAKLRKGADGEDAAETARREAEQAATAKANKRIVRSEAKAAASGKLADPKDVLIFLDLDSFEVNEDGEVDADEIAEAIDDLLKQKPYLGAATAKRFQGTGDGGAARKAGKPKQLTRQDLKSMTPEQIDKAREDGRLADLMSGG